jgi:chromosome segregation ATPase
MDKSIKDPMIVNKSEFKSNLSNVRNTLKNLENSNFFAQIMELEQKSNYLSNHSEELEQKLVFLGIENERLSMLKNTFNNDKILLINQIDSLKQDFFNEKNQLVIRYENKNKEYNDLFLGFKEKNDEFKKEKNEYLRRINELEKLHFDLENQFKNINNYYITEKNNATNLYAEKVRLENNLQEMENSFNLQLQDLRKEHEENFRSLEKNYQNNLIIERNNVLNQQQTINEKEKETLIKNYNSLLNEKNDELIKIQTSHNEATLQIDHFFNENQNLNKIIAKLEKIIQEKEEEVTRGEKNNERKILDLKKNLAFEQEQLTLKIKDEAKLKYSKMTSNFEKDIKSLKKKLIDSENEAQYYKNEKEYLEENKEDLRLKNEKLEKDLHSLRIDYENEIEEMSQQIDIYKKTYIDPKEYEIRFKAELSSYQAQITQLTQKLEQSNNKNVALLNENENLQRLSLERLKDIEKFKNNLYKLNDSQEVEEFQNEIRELKSDYENLLEENQKLKYDINSLNLKLKSVENEKNTISGENFELKNYLQQNKLKITSLEDQVRDLKKVQRNLMLEKNEIESNILIMKEKNHNISNQFEGIIRERDHYKQSMESSEERLLNTNKELTYKIQELELLKKKYLNACHDFEQKSQTNMEKKSVYTSSLQFNNDDNLDYR